MRQTDLIQRQVELVAVSIGGRVRRLHDALEALSFMTRQLLATAHPTTEEVDGWIASEGFAVLPSGFFEREAVVERARSAGSLKGEVTWAWGAADRDDPGARRRMYLLRLLAPHVTAVHERLKGVAWIYFQDALKHHCAMVAPGLAPDVMIPADFDWHTYHSFTIVTPEADPSREVRWSPPNVDYAGQGLISCVSIPLYEGDTHIGVWTMDVRLEELHRDLALDALGAIGARQVNFLADLDGRLLAHPSLGPEAQGEKGSVYSVQLASLGGDYATLDLAALAAKGHGIIELADAKGDAHLVAFRSVPEIRWVVFAAFPAADLVEATQSAFKQAFAHLGAGDLSFRLDAVGDETMQQLVGAFNEMTATLSESLLRRERAEAERRRMARELEIAATIQLSMLPRRPAHDEYEFAGMLRSADEVGGDFYDVMTRGERLWITIGDVSSHGLGAGLVMMLAQMAFRTVFEAAPDLGVDEAVRRVNRIVHANATGGIGGGRYLTGQLLAHRGDGVFDVAGAHLWPLVIDPRGASARRHDAPGPWIGIIPDLPAVPVSNLRIEPGEVLCLYSDGIIEARGRDGEMYDLDRMTARLTELLHTGMSLADCAAALHADVEAFSDERDDDRTVLLVRRR